MIDPIIPKAELTVSARAKLWLTAHLGLPERLSMVTGVISLTLIAAAIFASRILGPIWFSILLGVGVLGFLGALGIAIYCARREYERPRNVEVTADEGGFSFRGPFTDQACTLLLGLRGSTQGRTLPPPIPDGQVLPEKHIAAPDAVRKYSETEREKLAEEIVIALHRHDMEQLERFKQEVLLEAPKPSATADIAVPPLAR